MENGRDRTMNEAENPGHANLPIGAGGAEKANQEIGDPGDLSGRVWHREYWDRYTARGHKLR